jgi:hypothetical protein
MYAFIVRALADQHIGAMSCAALSATLDSTRVGCRAPINNLARFVSKADRLRQ